MGWLLGGIAMLVFNTLFGAGRLVEKVPDPGTRLAVAFGQTLALTLIVGVLALLSPENRNPRSLGKVLFWTQLIAFFMVVARS